MKKYRIGIVGATGAVGQEIIKLMEKRDFPASEIRLLASAKSAGREVEALGNVEKIEETTPDSFKELDIAIFSAGSNQSLDFAEHARRQGCVVIDNSSAFRMDQDVPLVIPEINEDALSDHRGIIANPNCSTAITLMGLYPLHKRFGLKIFFASTYQAVSGAGKASVDELFQQTEDYLKNKKITSKNFSKQIAFNLIPHIDSFGKDGYTKEELKMINETKKILDEKIELTATCVRIPVLVSHSEAVNIEFEKPYTLEMIRDALNNAEGCEVLDKTEDGGYSTPLEATGKDETYISRIRKDKTKENALNIWIVSDNLLRGAALNSVEIAETIINSK